VFQNRLVCLEIRIDDESFPFAAEALLLVKTDKKPSQLRFYPSSTPGLVSRTLDDFLSGTRNYCREINISGWRFQQSLPFLECLTKVDPNLVCICSKQDIDVIRVREDETPSQ